MTTLRKNQLLEVFASDNSAKVDREAGIIRGVRVLGSESRNKRKYLAEAMKKAIPLYEGRQVNANHERNPNVTRPIEDVVGWLRNVREENGGLTGDLHLLKSDPRFEKICESAERNPTLFGLSHDADGKWTMRDGFQVVEEIERVRSVDIVSDPATTRSLFESFDSERNPDMDPVTGAVPTLGGGDMTWQMFVEKAQSIFNGEGDAAAKAKSIGALAKTLLKITDTLDAAVNGKPAAGDGTPTTEGCKPDGKMSEAVDKAKLDRLEAENLLLKAGVPAESALLEAVVALDTPEKKKALVESFQKKVKPEERPRSASPSNRMTESKTEAAKTTDDFVFAISR